MTKEATQAQKDRAAHIQAQLMTASDEDKETISMILADVVDTILSDNGAGVLFFDKNGEGSMSVHMLGEIGAATGMLQAAPAVYESLFATPSDAKMQ